MVRRYRSTISLLQYHRAACSCCAVRCVCRGGRSLLFSGCAAVATHTVAPCPPAPTPLSFSPPAGHEHTYQRSCPLYNYSCVAPNRDGTQRAPVYALFGNAG